MRIKKCINRPYSGLRYCNSCSSVKSASWNIPQPTNRRMENIIFAQSCPKVSRVLNPRSVKLRDFMNWPIGWSSRVMGILGASSFIKRFMMPRSLFHWLWGFTLDWCKINRPKILPYSVLEVSAERRLNGFGFLSFRNNSKLFGIIWY